MTITVVAERGHLSDEQIHQTLAEGLGDKFAGQRVLVLIPDHTRSLPLPMLFRQLVEVLGGAKQLDFMVALGTHPPLSEQSLHQLVGITQEDHRARYARVRLLNHAWDQPAELARLGVMEQDEIRALAGSSWHPSLPARVPIMINRAALEHDHLLIVGPTFPHEVAGFSGGLKYLFPGISGPEMIHATHWLAALATVVGTIGIKDTPVRRMINAAASRLSTPVTLAACVVEERELGGLIVGDPLDAWSHAADLSAQRHVRWCEHAYTRVLSCPPPMYDELWTAAKAMYKLEPAVAKGGEVVIYAPHLAEVSRVHGKYIHRVGYHILPYFLRQWARFRDVPLGVLAHSTHLRGSGTMDDGMERPNVKVTLASQIGPEECARLNLGYMDPAGVKMAEWQGREGDGILVVPHAGETLYKVR